MNDYSKKCDALSCEIGEVLGKGIHFGVIGAHMMLVHALWNALNTGFFDDSSPGIVLIVALDTRRQYAIKKALSRHAPEDAPIEIQVTTPSILEHLMSRDMAQFAAMMKLCQQIIVWIQPDDLRDNTLAYWLNIYSRLRAPESCGIGYFGGPWLISSKLDKFHPKFQWIGDREAACAKSTHISFWNPDTDDLPDSAIFESAREMQTLVNCRNETLKMRYSEALHRAHIHQSVDERKPSHPGTQFISSDILSEFVMPNIAWNRVVCVNPKTTDAQVSGLCSPDESNIGLSILATSRFALLSSAARLINEPNPVNDCPTWLVDVCTLFSSIESGHIQTSQLNAFSSEFVEFWEKSGIATRIDSGVELTAHGRQLFPGIQAFSQFGVLHSFYHDVYCETANHEPLSLISSEFLRNHEYFMLNGHSFQRQCFNILGNTSVLRMQQPKRGQVWIDASAEFISNATAQAFWRVLSEKKSIPEGIFDDSAKSAFKQLQREFSTLKSPNTLEISAEAAHWWTFAGARHNAFLSNILSIVAPEQQISYGNLFIRLKWPSSDVSSRQIELQLEAIANKVDEFSKDTSLFQAQLYAIWERQHIYQWLFVLLPPERIKALFAEACRDWAKAFVKPALVEVETVHQIDAIVDIEKAEEPKRISRPQIKPVATHQTPRADARAIERGDGTSQMKTRYPWTYVDTEIKLARALNVILKQDFIGLDVETTLFDQRLCLIQIGCSNETFLIDPLAIDFSDLAQVFSHPNIIKVIHNAQFETMVLKKYGMDIQNIVDTMKVSRKLYGMKCPGGHSLKAVCLREFGYVMDKTCQTSRWDMRPLSAVQLEYAALDAEIMIHLYRHFML